MQNLSEESNTN